MKIDKRWMMSLGLVLPLAGCPGDDGPAETGAEGSTTEPAASSGSTGDTVVPVTGDTTSEPTSDTVDPDSSGDPPVACPGTGIGTAAVGDACTANADCASAVCTLFTDVPPDESAVCAETPPECGMRITGTVFDFTTREPLSGATVAAVGALQAATNPTGAVPLVDADSDNDGRIDATTPAAVTGAFGLVGLTSAGGYYLTATGLGAPNDEGDYAVANSIHDIWAVPDSDLADWSDALADDAMIPAENLPLGEAGGVVGLVRDSGNQPVAGAVVSSTEDGSGAFIRYLNDDGTFGTDSTSDLGIFVILEPALAESFEVEVGGAIVGGGTAGSADGAIFTLIVNAD